MEEKFRWLTRYALENDRIDPLVRLVWEFDSVSSVRDLTQRLTR